MLGARRVQLLGLFVVAALFVGFADTGTAWGQGDRTQITCPQEFDLFSRTQNIEWSPSGGRGIVVIFAYPNGLGGRPRPVAFAPDTGEYPWDTTTLGVSTTNCVLRVFRGGGPPATSGRFIVDNDEELKIRADTGEGDPATPGPYHSVQEIENALNELDTNRSIRLQTIRRADADHMPIYVALISDPDDTRTDKLEPEPATFILAGLHAREFIGPQCALALVHTLATSDDELIKRLRDNTKMYIVVTANPDALTWSQRYWDRSVFYPHYASLVAGPDAALLGLRDGRHRRKNLTGHADDHLFNFTENPGLPATHTGDALWGTDLNRNFPGTFSDVGCETSDVYPGPSALSETESSAIASFLTTEFPVEGEVLASLDLHNNEQKLYYQHTVPGSGSHYNEIVDRLSTHLLRAVNSGVFSFSREGLGPNDPIKGAFDTHVAHGFHIPSFTLELPSNQPGVGFWVPKTSIVDVVNPTLYMVRNLVDWTTGPAIAEELEIKSDGEVHEKWTDVSRTDRELQFLSLQPLAAGEHHEVRIRFSRPMTPPDGGSPPDPVVTWGREEPYADFDVTRSGGWTKTKWENDTWVGDMYIDPDDPRACGGRLVAVVPFHLSISTQDPFENQLDGDPATMVKWQGEWKRYEDERHADRSEGGKDWNFFFFITGSRACDELGPP